mmetsp:Transcript_118007/g.216254  ORF Transcript_118007/g.216254 Transcript_118007/m.216254 type:complete len:1035 (+) Transcript_118007:158-3262(+)
MGGSGGEAWKALYSDSGSDGEAPAKRTAKGVHAAEDAVQHSPAAAAPVPESPLSAAVMTAAKRRAPQPVATSLSEEVDAPVLFSMPRKRGRPPKSAASRLLQELQQPSPVVAHVAQRQLQALEQQPQAAPEMAPAPVADASASRRTKRTSGGALGLLEPDSSDSDVPNPPAYGSPATSSSANVRAAVVPMPPSPAPAELSTPLPAGMPQVAATPAKARARVSGPRSLAAAPDAGTAEQLAADEKAAAAAAAEMAYPLQVPGPSGLGPAARRGGRELLAAFPGPEEGLAPRWSEGSLELPEGAVLPECIAACLRPYQRDGVLWLYERLFLESRGCLLTDEMGLGKTVQVACCLAAGLYARARTAGRENEPGPVLVLCPPSLVQNWARELRRWGPFAVETLAATGGPSGGRVRILQRMDAGLTDVLVASRGLLRGDEDGAPPDMLCARSWGCVVIDEVHQAKNPKGLLHRALCQLSCPRKLGLTGTPLQNSLTDFWALLRISGAHEGWTLSEFESRFGRPITRGQKRKASVRDLAVREDALKEFQQLLSRNCLRRTKAEVALMLPGKNDRIVPCPLSSVQRAAYRNLLASPDWQLALGKRKLCVCGAGGQCLCGAGPIWRYIHQKQAEQKGLEDERAAADDCVCRCRCPPKCMSLSLIVILQRITNHIELLKPDPQPPRETAEQAQQELMGQLCDIAFAGIDHNLCTQRRIANRLQLGSPESCGKMQVLLPLLRHWRRQGRKVLVFSRSTRLLDILEACLWQQGWSPQTLRLDGGTPPGQRQRLVDEFNTSSTRGVFLISTRAGGVGLNLTAASVVVIFDPDWNPFSDLQAQDRSFRIGQTRVVEVYRLLSAGTIEEQVYVRQVWKQQLAASAIDGTRSARRLDDGAFGLGSLFELHETSVLPSLMAEAFTARAQSQPQEMSEAGVRIFSDMRGSSGAGMQLTELWQPEDEAPADDAAGAEDAGASAPAAGADHPAGEAGAAAVAASAARAGAPNFQQGATQALEALHGMFDQLDHSKVVRNDTQENILLNDLPDA